MLMKTNLQSSLQRFTPGTCRWILAATAALTVCLLAACGDNPQPESSSANRADTPAATVPPQTLNDRQQQARQVLAERLSAPVDSLALVSDEPVSWSDASLGCPEEGMMYAQVITPGHRITFSYQGEQYEVHTSRDDGAGSQLRMVSCEGGTSY